tara:strand:+ start:132 stop:440 length:309 start_codon:yes stop_codon:yes gene_type:complete
MYKQHNPKLYKPLMDELLKRLDKEWYDSSYGNDLVASISFNIPNDPNDDVITVLFPNSINENWNNEEFSNFVIKKTIQCSDDELITCKNIDEVITQVKQLTK